MPPTPSSGTEVRKTAAVGMAGPSYFVQSSSASQP